MLWISTICPSRLVRHLVFSMASADYLSLKSWLAASQKKHCEICGYKYNFTKGEYSCFGLSDPQYIPTIYPAPYLLRCTYAKRSDGRLKSVVVYSDYGSLPMLGLSFCRHSTCRLCGHCYGPRTFCESLHLVGERR